MVVTSGGLGLFAPRFGIMAAAFTSVIAYATVTAVLFRLRTAPVVGAGTTVSGTVALVETSLSDNADQST